MLPALKVGGLYVARVLGQAGDGRVLIELGGVTMPARAEAPVKAGQTVTVEVDSLNPVVVLRIVPDRQEVPVEGK
jgi:hypothetical protein